MVHHVQYFVQRVHGRGRIDDHRRLAAVRFDQLQCAVQVNACFLVHGDPIRASVCKRGNVAVGILDHQVAVENGVGKRFAQRSHDRRANRDVRHEVTIHNVQVQHRATAFERGFSVVGEPREVRGEYRRGQFNGHKRLSWQR